MQSGCYRQAKMCLVLWFFFVMDWLFLLEAMDSAFYQRMGGGLTDLSFTQNHRFRWYSGKYLQKRYSYYYRMLFMSPFCNLSSCFSGLSLLNQGGGVMELLFVFLMILLISSLTSVQLGSLGMMDSVKVLVKTELMHLEQSVLSFLRNNFMRQSPISPSIFRWQSLQHPSSNKERVLYMYEVGRSGDGELDLLAFFAFILFIFILLLIRQGSFRFLYKDQEVIGYHKLIEMAVPNLKTFVLPISLHSKPKVQLPQSGRSWVIDRVWVSFALSLARRVIFDYGNFHSPPIAAFDKMCYQFPKFSLVQIMVKQFSESYLVQLNLASLKSWHQCRPLYSFFPLSTLKKKVSFCSFLLNNPNSNPFLMIFDILGSTTVQKLNLHLLLSHSP